MRLRLLSSTPEGQARRGIYARATLAGVALALLTYLSLTPTSNHAIDLAYDYVTAKAFLEGIDISSVTVADLGVRYLPELTALDLYHYPNAHPPALVLLSTPFTLLPFSIVGPVWLLVNVLLVLAIGRWLGLSRSASLALVAWPSLFYLLRIGQYEVLILFLLVMGWRAARNERDFRAGALIGLAAVLKFYPGLFIVPFLVRRRFRLAAATCLVFLLGQLIGSVLIGGPAGLVGYYQRLAGLTNSTIQSWWANSSAYGALQRTLKGVGDVPPLVYLPEIVWPVTLVLSLVGLVALIRLRPEAAPVATLVALPNTAFYHLVLALPQIVFLLRQGPSSRPLGRAIVIAAVAAGSLVLAMANATAALLVATLSLSGPIVNNVLVILVSVQPLGFLALLVLSFLAEPGAIGLPNVRSAENPGPERASAIPE